jgi:UDP-galactopyranose mutase
MNLVVGAGLSGATCARKLAESGRDVLVIEKNSFIGGNCYDSIHPITKQRNSQFGPHFFHTNNEEVWKFVNQFAEWIPYSPRMLSHVENIYVPVPVCQQTVNQLYDLRITSEEEMIQWLNSERTHYDVIENSEQVAISRVGSRLYNALFKGYTQKQWERDASELAPSVLERIPVRTNTDDRYFTDIYQALPKEGYTTFIQSILDHPLIKVECDQDYFKDYSHIRGRFENVIYTGPVDRMFADQGLEPLEYRSLKFRERIIDVKTVDEKIQPGFQVNESSINIPYTRTCEYSHSLNQGCPVLKSLIVEEYPQSHGDPYYPVPTKRNSELFAKYKQLSDESGIHFVGRLASYKYYNMDQAIAAAFDICQRIVPKVEGS